MKAGNKVVFFVSSLEKAGGIEKISTIISSSLAKRGIKVILLSLNSKDTFFSPSPDVRIETLNLYRGGIFRLLQATLRLFSFIRNERPNYFICVGASLILYSLFPILFYKTKYLMWEHFSYSYIWNKYTTKLSRKLAAKFCDIVITLNEDDLQYYRIMGANATIIPNPTPNIHPHLKPKNNIVLSVGRLVNVKGYDLLLQSWSHINNKGSWQLFIVGDGEERERLENLIDLYNIRDSVKIHSSTNKIDEFYSIASIYALSSRSECFPMVLLEAESHSLPIVCYDCGSGVKSLVKNEINGFIVPLEDVYTYALKLKDLMNNNQLRENLGNNSLNIANKYSIDKITNLWMSTI